MVKRRFGFDDAKKARFEREGRGTGSGTFYQPWLTVHDLSSSGRSARMLGRHNRRIHHLFSDIERGAFLEYDWRDDVQDIREQFPLDRGLTRAIAFEMGVRHPRDPRSGTDIVMTTDFLVDMTNGCRAVSCKLGSDLTNPRTLEKVEIERRYWDRLGRRFGIWTELSTTKTRTHNLAFLHEYMDADEWRWCAPGHWTVRSLIFIDLLAQSDLRMPFEAFAAAFERVGGFASGDAMATLRYLACRKRVTFDLDVRFDHTAPIGRSLRPASASVVVEAA